MLLLVLLLPTVCAQLEYYGVESVIEADRIDYIVTLKFAKPTQQISWESDFAIFNLSPEAEFGVECSSKVKLITCNFTGMSETQRLVKLSFSSLEGVERLDGKLRYRASYTIPFHIERAFIIIKLPEKGVLVEPTNASFSPADGKIITDGRRIMVYWDRVNLTAGEGLLFSVSYVLPTEGFDYLSIALIVIALVIFGFGGLFVLRRVKMKRILTAILTADEKAIVDVLGRRGGQALQKQIVRETDFSKAKVSRLLRALQRRGVVRIEPVSGRENRVILVLERHEEKGSSEDSKAENREAV